MDFENNITPTLFFSAKDYLSPDVGKLEPII